MRMTRTAALLALVGGAVAATLALTRDSDPRHDALRDRSALLANANEGPAAFVREYTRLADMLPNVKDADGRAATDSIVVGTVSSVVDGAGYIELNVPNAPRPGVPGATVTLFNDPLADWRTLRVTIAVDETLAGHATQSLEVSWPVMGNSRTGQDKDAIGRALKGLGRIVVISTARPNRPEYLGIQRDVPDKEAGILQVASDGSLTLPFAPGSGSEGESLDPTAFLAGLDTLDELRAEAAKPARAFPYASPSG